MKKRKTGVILILVGIGIMLVARVLANGIYRGMQWGRFMDYFGFEVPLKYPLAAGALVILIGIGIIILSLFPKEKKISEKGKEI